MRACLIGCGNMGAFKDDEDPYSKVYKTHLHCLVDNPIVTEISLYDTDESAAVKAIDKFSYASWKVFRISESVPEGMDIYTIATPKETHAYYIDMINDFSAKPRFVVCEKPCGANLQDAISIASVNRFPIRVNYQRHYDMALIEAIQSGFHVHIKCLDDFEWLCHAYHLETVAPGNRNVTVESVPENVFEVYINDKLLPRFIDTSMMDLYTNNDGYEFDAIENIYVHLRNEYGRPGDKRGETCTFKALDVSDAVE